MNLTSAKTLWNFWGLRARPEWSFRDVDRKEMFSFSHAYHRYPAKFVPHIVVELIKKYAPNGNELICDPFGGCGTTLVEAKASGYRSVGYDINPVANLITRVKVKPIRPIQLVKSRASVIAKYHSLKSITIDHHPRIRYWFDLKTIRKLNKIYFAIMQIPDKQVREFFLVAFSQNLKTSSKWLMSSIKPQIDPVKIIGDPEKTFLRHLDFMIKKNEEYYRELKSRGYLKTPAKMKERDSTKRLPLRTKSVDLIITSPPYVTSYEYADLHQLSLFWFASSLDKSAKWKKQAENFSHFRKQFIGTSFKHEKPKVAPGNLAKSIVKKLESVDRPLSINVENYFTDINKAFAEFKRVLKPGGKICLIVGNTNLRSVQIRNAEVATEQLFLHGFRRVDIIKREVINTMIAPWRDTATGKFTGIGNPDRKRAYQYEYVIVMEKGGH